MIREANYKLRIVTFKERQTLKKYIKDKRKIHCRKCAH